MKERRKQQPEKENK